MTFDSICEVTRQFVVELGDAKLYNQFGQEVSVVCTDSMVYLISSESGEMIIVFMNDSISPLMCFNETDVRNMILSYAEIRND